ncbi:MAG: hypothetical protein LKI59_00065 [Bacteroidales bacterium]|jgi:hypothetical protein|nr:hypothetical protein [Bacteroidales bacterium]
MNYLTEIRLFYDKLPSFQLTSSDIALWHGLMNIFNRAGWPQDLSISPSEIQACTCISKTGIFRCRQNLSKAGLIEFLPQKGCRCGIYRIMPLSLSIAIQIGTQAFQIETLPVHSGTQAFHSGTQNDSENEFAFQIGSQSGTQTESTPIIENKLNNNISLKEKDKKKKFSWRVWISTIDRKWQPVMEQWLEYKSERKEDYSGEMSLSKLLTRLRNLSGDNPATAQQIIDRSIVNSWKGLFPLDGGYQAQKAPQQGQHIGQIMQPSTEADRNSVLDNFRNKISNKKQ